MRSGAGYTGPKSRSLAVILGLGAMLGTSTEELKAQVLAPGWNHTLAVNQNLTAVGWGFNGANKATGGNGVGPLSAVSAGYGFSLGLRTNGTVVAWGDNSYNLVSGVSNLGGITAISAGNYHAVALRSNGTVAAWGDTSNNKVAGASSVTNATAVAAGGDFSLALRANGTVAAWGFNGSNQVTGANSVSNAVAIAAGYAHGLALKSNGTVSAWGSNASGQTSGITSLSNVVGIAGSWDHSLALRSNGTVVGFGSNTYSQVSGGNSYTDLVWVGAGQYYSYGVRRDGSIVSWGRNTEGQRNTPSNLLLPVEVKWASATSGDYLNSHLWNGRIPSTALSYATFDKSGTYSISFGTNAQAKGLAVTAGNVTFNLNGYGYQVGDIGLEVGSTANLLINSGQLTTARMWGAGQVAINSNLYLNGTSNWNLTNWVTGPGTVFKTGGDTITVTTGLLSSSNLWVQAGTMQLGSGNRIGDFTKVLLNGGTLALANGNTEKIGSLLGTSNVNLNSGTLQTGNDNSSTTYSGIISGSGSFTKLGSGTMTLTGANLFSGTAEVSGGTLQLSGNDALNGASLVSVQSGATLAVNNATSQVLQAVQSAGNVSISGSSVVYGSNFTNSGNLSISGSSTLSMTNLVNSVGGVIDVAAGSTILANSFQNDSGATVDLAGQVSAWNLVNNGIINGDLNLTAGQVLSGSGTINGLTTVDTGTVIAPGNSIGSMNLTDLVLGPSGILEMEISDATGLPGSEWDFLNVSGALTIDATDANPFTIALVSYLGDIANFDDSLNYSWTMLTAAGGISGFDQAKFSIDSGSFTNPHTGSFSVAQLGNSINLMYSASAVPEPGSLAFVLFGGLAVATQCRRRSLSN